MKRRATISTEQETEALEASLAKLNQATVKEKEVVTPETTQQEESSKPVHRYNIEIPLDLFEEIKAHIEDTGQNLKGFFLKSAKFYMKNSPKE